MSIAICFVARTGIVMGTDSRVTTTVAEGKTREDGYPKLVQFGRQPIGMAMVGAGSYAGRDFRSLVAETYLSVCPASGAPHRVEHAAREFAEVAGAIARESGSDKTMTVLVAGYSPGQPFGELWEVTLPDGEVSLRAGPNAQTLTWRGRADAINALWWGANLPVLHRVLEEHGMSHDDAVAVMDDVKQACAWGPERLNWGMPLSSAVDLVRFQLTVQIEAERFLPGRSASGHPVQLLAINDAGLHWVDNPFDRFAAVGCDPTT